MEKEVLHLALADLTQLMITGAIVSLLVQFIKSSSKYFPGGARMLTIVFSIAAGVIYWFVKDNAAFLTAVAVIAVFANAVYGFVISYFEPPRTEI